MSVELASGPRAAQTASFLETTKILFWQRWRSRLLHQATVSEADAQCRIHTQFCLNLENPAGWGNPGVNPTHRSGCPRPIWLARLSTGLRLSSSAIWA